jgi:hypothetical protein
MLHFTSLKRNRAILNYNGYQYTMKRAGVNRNVWRCRQRSCSSTLSLLQQSTRWWLVRLLLIHANVFRQARRWSMKLSDGWRNEHERKWWPSRRYIQNKWSKLESRILEWWPVFPSLLFKALIRVSIVNGRSTFLHCQNHCLNYDFHTNGL